MLSREIDPDDQQEKRQLEEARRLILKKYMLRSWELANGSMSELSEKSFDNLNEEADSPRGRSPLFDAKKLEKMEWELSTAGTRLGTSGRVLFFFNCVFCFKFFYILPLELVHNGGWYFLVPLAVCCLLMSIPMVFLELAMGQFTSQLVTVHFGRIAPVAKGVGYAMAIFRVLLFLHFRTEHRIVALIWNVLQSVLFTNRNAVCTRQNATDCYIPGACRKGEVFYQGSCYDRPRLWDERRIPSQMNLRLAAAELLQDEPFNDGFVQYVLPAEKIFDLDDNTHFVSSVITFFILVFLASKWGVVRFSRFLPVLYSLLAVLLINISVILLFNPAFQSAFVLYLEAVAFSSQATVLYSVKTWQTAAVDAFVLFGCGDGTLQALGAMSSFANNLFWDLLYVGASFLILVPFSIFFFGAIIVDGINVEQREMNEKAFVLENMTELVQQLKVYPYSVSCMTPLYYLSWVDQPTQVCACCLFLILLFLQLAPHILMAENILTASMRLVKSLSALNASLVRHCVMLTYFCSFGLVYAFYSVLGDAEKRYIGKLCCSLVLSAVFWQCVTVRQLYDIDRLLVNIRTMFDKSPWAYKHTKALARPLYHLWAWFIPLLAGLFFITTMLATLRAVHGPSWLLVFLLLVAFMPVYVAAWLVVTEWLRPESQMSRLFRPTADWGPFSVLDKKNANYDEKAARIFI